MLKNNAITQQHKPFLKEDNLHYQKIHYHDKRQKP